MRCCGKAGRKDAPRPACALRPGRRLGPAGQLLHPGAAPRRYEIDFCQSPDDAPDFVIAGTFGHTALDYACCRIQYSGEDSWPDLNLYDYALGFPLLSYEGRYMRLPLYAMRDTWAPALEKHRADPAEVFARPGFAAASSAMTFRPSATR